MIETLRLGGVIAVVLVAMVTDLRARRIPNWLTVPGLVMGIGLATVGGGWIGLGMALLGAVVGFVLFLIPYFFGGMGAGDVKLMAAVGALVGFPAILPVVLYSAIAGGLISLIVVLRDRSARMTFLNLLMLLAVWRKGAVSGAASPERWKSVGSIPYGVAICFGVLTYVYFGNLVL